MSITLPRTCCDGGCHTLKQRKQHVEINKVKYKQVFSGGMEKMLELPLRGDNLVPVAWIPSQPPQWAALKLANLIGQYNNLELLDTVKLIVKTADWVVVSVIVQKVLGSFIGLLMATSDRPHACRSGGEKDVPLVFRLCVRINRSIVLNRMPNL